MKYIVKKALTLVGTLLLVSFIAFLLFQIVPGDPVTSMLGTEYSEERAESLREELGINKPVIVRYVNWLTDFVKGDFGISYKYKMPVSKLISDKMPVTMYLAVITLIIIVVISIPLGVFMARFGHRKVSKVFDIVNQSVMAIPSFFLGIVITIIFGLVLKWFTPGKYVSYRDDFNGFIMYLIPAAFAVAIPKIAMMVKFLKNSLIREMDSDYVRTAYSKGAGESRVLFCHVLRNGLMPAITLLGMIIAEIMAGSIVVEQVFNLPGLSAILVSSVSTRDYPVVQAIVVYIAFVVIITNCIVDILYHIIDPRVKN
ncbi:MAG: ABC transporter permease [Lachnospiraceae bacterium]|nr:ABC transporter permease [Clostridiales bacterium]MDD6292777.1 ABC transporter permease [Eubacteriales bacterium]MDY2607427.1 ABC transporter permease [Lachnospiraceae bacterium]MDY6328070.1 ABC transporter permease [Lachnospiraceae bacterium]